MPPTDALTTFFGWCTLINVGIYLLTVGAFMMFRRQALRISARIFGITEEQVARITFLYVGIYKLAITVFCFVPWIALTLMS